MRIEVRCSSCGKGYLVEEARLPEAGGTLPCLGCGCLIDIRPPRSSAPTPTVPPSNLSADLVCPRCGLHFQPATERKPDPSRSRPTILVVEDMEYFREIARDALGERYEVKTAASVGAAKAILSTSKVDLILLDQVLENAEDGLRLLRELPRKPCPVLIYTAQDESEMYGDGWDRLRALGADDLVIKGMNAGDSLVRKVGHLLGESTLDSVGAR